MSHRRQHRRTNIWIGGGLARRLPSGRCVWGFGRSDAQRLGGLGDFRESVADKSFVPRSIDRVGDPSALEPGDPRTEPVHPLSEHRSAAIHEREAYQSPQARFLDRGKLAQSATFQLAASEDLGVLDRGGDQGGECHEATEQLNIVSHHPIMPMWACKPNGPIVPGLGRGDVSGVGDGRAPARRTCSPDRAA